MLFPARSARYPLVMKAAITAMLCGLILGGAAQASAAELYRWVDADGQVHYSDRPHAGATSIEIDITPPAISTPASTTTSSPGTARSADEPALPEVESMRSINLTRPTENQVLHNIAGQLSVAVSVTPRLAEGHRINLYMDGNRIVEGQPGRLAFRLDEVYRGEHTLIAAVEEPGGRELLRSDAVTFFVRQTSIQNRAN